MPLNDLMCKPFLTWVGSKSKLQNIIRLVFPPGFTRYVEHFGGSGAILLGTPKKSGVLEVFNDYDSDLTNLFLCVRDRPMALMRALGCFPTHSEEEFELLKQFLDGKLDLFDFSADEQEVAESCLTEAQLQELEPILMRRAQLWDVRRAAAYYKVNHGSFSGTMRSFGVKPNPIRRFLSAISRAAKRLEEVVITHRDFADSVKLNNKPNTLHYFDPPYYKTEDKYLVPFTDDDHRRLHDLIPHIFGHVVISYSNSDFIRDLYRDYYILGFERPNSMSQKQSAVFEEIVITNFDPRPVMEYNLAQTTMFAPLDKNRMPGKLVLIHEPENN